MIVGSKWIVDPTAMGLRQVMLEYAMESNTGSASSQTSPVVFQVIDGTVPHRDATYSGITDET